jgi:hypothetical protein
MEIEALPPRAIPYKKLQPTMRARFQKFDTTFQHLDALAGWAEGYGSKLLASTPMKRIGPISLPLILSVLGVRLILVDARRKPPKTGNLFAGIVGDWNSLQTCLMRRFYEIHNRKEQAPPMRSPVQVAKLVKSLGLEVLVIEDPESLSTISRRLAPRKFARHDEAKKSRALAALSNA